MIQAFNSSKQIHSFSNMKKNIIYLLAFLTVCCGTIFNSKAQIIPHPLEMKYGSGEMVLESDLVIIGSSEVQNEAEYLADFLEKGFGRKAAIRPIGEGLKLVLENNLIEKLGVEGYRLRVQGDGITIEAATPTGIFYGVQTFRQLLPVTFEHSSESQAITIPYVEITDKPRFQWRAFMLDESRHFMGGMEVKKLLDQMALLKMNTFHWHLTDDQGWRIEIKKYPMLTAIGAKRKDTQMEYRSEKRYGESHEGFYTQEEIKEIISYAKERHITIVPEIEMPGHAMAAIAGYPWLGALGTTETVPEIFGKMPDSFNISDPKVVGFLKDVLDEVISLFPGEAIHIGGDEVNYDPWIKSDEIQAFMAKENLKSPVDLQIYFTNQISNYLENAGKRMMGWNEIMGDDIHEEREESQDAVEQKLASSSIVHFWKGDLSLIQKAVEGGYQVVNSNHWDTYLDYTYERLPLSKSYAFNPIPDDLEEKYHKNILGTGTQMWTEWTPNVEALEKQIFPRLIAYAEVGWTVLENKNYERFLKALQEYKQRLKLKGISFYESL